MKIKTIIILLFFLGVANAQRIVYTNMLTDTLNARFTNLGIDSVSISGLINDSLDNYVSKAGTDTISGAKVFTNNKTVFGTSTSDSVGMRGNLDVDGKITTNTIQGNTSNAILFSKVSGASDSLQIFSGSEGVKIRKSTIGIGLSVNKQSNSGTALVVTNAGTGSTASFVGTTNGVTVDNNGNLVIDSLLTINDYTFPYTDGISGQIIKTDGIGGLYWGTDATGTGGSSITDSIYINGRAVTGDSVATLEQIEGYVPLTDDGYLWLTSDWLDYSSPNVLRLGKSHADRRLNNGAYSDVWIIDYVVPPYNLSEAFNIAHEHRTDYYNDTLKDFTNVFNLFNIDGTGTPIWGADPSITAHKIHVNVGDLPDSVGLDWTWDNFVGVDLKMIDEANMTAGAKRFPMPMYGYRFRFGGDISNYTFPKVYGFYSDFTQFGDQARVDSGWHFYGKGDFPSYFGGDIRTSGSITLIDALLDPVTIEPVGGIGGGTGIKAGETVQVTGESSSYGYSIGGNVSDIVPPQPMTGNWDWGLPDKSGTIAVTSVISDSLKNAYLIKAERIDFSGIPTDSTAVPSGYLYMRSSDGIIRRKY